MDKYFRYKLNDLFNPTIKALKKLGGSGAISEIEEEVIQFCSKPFKKIYSRTFETGRAFDY